MAHTRATAFICAWALFANITAIPAPPRRNEKQETPHMAQERTIVIRRVPNAYIYPFSLWPLPKNPVLDDRTVEYIYNGKTLKKIKVENNKR
ncbi:unnamed protein product [Danaus chrysippus]|uniref:(African queen) hypothetical protein n=1 Tax=Danaus chrysippus TaxID=151541 RepID=A0A8J2W388_9NEOP|nr:unnamed protein product [Danaus chrysippus]